MKTNLLLQTDSYKMAHHAQYQPNCTNVYSYFEAREGATYDKTVFFGLQYILKEFLEGYVFTGDDVNEANDIAEKHFGPGIFNLEGWLRLLEKHGGKLPLRIKAVPEGLAIPNSNVLMTVENTDEEFPWLTNYFESLLTHVWYPSTVASKSYHVRQIIQSYLEKTADSPDGLPFMLHDFGYRGAASSEAAAIGGAAHLINFKGTDTLPAMEFAAEYYDANFDDLAFSVPATEHSVMTSLGKAGEMQIVLDLLAEYKTGILSVVADSYNIYEFVRKLGKPEFKDAILHRDGVFVVRPDSVTNNHPTPEALMGWIVGQLYASYGGERNSKGKLVLDPRVRVLWGDGIDDTGIEAILKTLDRAGYSAENVVFGMGGGLLQKLNRDTQRFAFKCSAQRQGGEWVDIQKDPIDSGKKSKAGRLVLTESDGIYVTANSGTALADISADVLETVFEDGKITKEYTFDEVRANSNL